TDEKEYIADVRLGVATPTYDATSLADGVRWPMTDGRWPIEVELDAVLRRFRGSFLQAPPPFSAKKIAGVPAHEKARRNQELELKPVPVTVRELEVLPASDITYPTSDIDPRTSRAEPPDATVIRLKVVASAGFYVRS